MIELQHCWSSAMLFLDVRWCHFKSRLPWQLTFRAAAVAYMKLSATVDTSVPKHLDPRYTAAALKGLHVQFLKDALVCFGIVSPPESTRSIYTVLSSILIITPRAGIAHTTRLAQLCQPFPLPASPFNP